MKPLRRSTRKSPQWRLLLALLGVLLAPAGRASIPLYINQGNSIYTVPGTPPPQIDAQAFFNDGAYTFEINFDTYNPGTPFYETMNTVNYTNAGTMIVNGPNLTNGISLLLGLDDNFGCGFQFDQQTASQNLWAGTFYNSGTVRCGSALDGNDVYFLTLSALYGSSYVFIPNILGECNVAATNVIVPGTIQVSDLGAINVTGRNVDLSQGHLIQEPAQSLNGLFSTAPINAVGAFGINTNILWDPAVYLGANYAWSSYVPLPPYNEFFQMLNNTTPYVDAEQVSSNYFVYRYVFIEDDSVNASASVYFDPLDYASALGGLYAEPGQVHIQWTGTYTDPASGVPVSGYLYLTDNYLFGATTNNFLYNGVPVNYVLTPSRTPQAMVTGPSSASFLGVGPDAFMTNNYAAFEGNLTASTANTNVSYANPHGSITNLAGHISVTASNELNLAFTTIDGPNYLNLNCTNQFDGSPGAYIAAPYSDIALGVTNGFLTVSNVLVANIANWSGPISAWSSVWDFQDTTGATNEFRVLVVYSNLKSTTIPWIKNLYLHGTNTLTISDHLNVYGSFFSDATTLVLNTNQFGQGAQSPDGEFNWINPATFNANSGSGAQQMPNLLWVTNSGLFQTANNANFGNASAPPFTVTPGVPAVTNYTSFNNHSLVSDLGTTIWTSYFESDGTISNGTGSFVLHAGLGMLTNGNISAGGDVLLVTTNNTGLGVNALMISNQVIQAGHQLTLWTTNLLGDAVTNQNLFVVGATSGGGVDSGFNTYLKPVTGNLLGATVTNIAPANKTIYNVWAGQDYGISPAGYTNNLAIGHLILDSFTTNTAPPIAFSFSGAGGHNALYVDLLELKDGAAVGDITNNYNFPWLKINTNMMIYFAQALEHGRSVAEAIDDQSKLGANGGRLRWVYSYAGYYSSTNLYFTNAYGSIYTNTVNTALAQSAHIDSDSDGQPNLTDLTPFFLPYELNFGAAVTNLPAPSVRVQWTTIPHATNFVYYSTNLFTSSWLPFTNFNNWYFGNNVAVTNAGHGNGFVSPQIYINSQSLPDNAQQTNVWLYDSVTNIPHYYKVIVWPALDFAP